MERRNGVDVLADGGEGGGVEDVNILELGDQEGVGRRSGLGEWRKVLQVDGERRVGAAFAEGGG